MRSGVIVAGGQSRRFGEAGKALADPGGTPMIRRVVDRLSAVVDELVVNCRPAQTAAIRTAMNDYPLTVTYAEDEVPDRRRVAGIRNDLIAVEGQYAFVVACDMPFVDPEVRISSRRSAPTRLRSRDWRRTGSSGHRRSIGSTRWSMPAGVRSKRRIRRFSKHWNDSTTS